MKPVREKTIIEIEVTNACAHECTNCSRFVGHYKKPYFMELATVERAIESLLDFPGGIGIMGGDPTMHPHFPEICELMRKYVPPHRRHLWTGGFKWDTYLPLIRRTFGENVRFNNHVDVTQKHHPMLLSISDVIDDPEHVRRLVADCWVDRVWSASINPKGCFFCEIAAAMDVLFDGPGGLAIERGWWKKDPEAFCDQRERYCFRCGASVPFPPVRLEDRKDVVSETNYRMLREVGSPKLEKGRVTVVRDKFAEPGLAAVAQDWKPWDHLGVKQKEGTGKTVFELYGRLPGALLKMRRTIRARLWTFRRLEILIEKLLWKLGLR